MYAFQIPPECHSEIKDTVMMRRNVFPLSRCGQPRPNNGKFFRSQIESQVALPSSSPVFAEGEACIMNAFFSLGMG